MTIVYRPSLLYSAGLFRSDAELLVGDDGRIMEIRGANSGPEPSSAQVVDLPGKALLPGFVNAHSHSFQRLIRGKAESRVTSGRDFWSWRGTMYHAAAQLTPEELYDVARMAFLEMLYAGTTTVGEFHYLHNAPGGRPFDDPNILSKQVIAAAQSVGIRIVLLRTAYLRSGFALPPDPGQMRFYESRGGFLSNMAALVNETPTSPAVTFGIAPHSIRAVPLDDLRAIEEYARSARLPVHMHVSEQVAENEACVREYGDTPVVLLEKNGLLGPDLTAVHATHITAEEIAMLAHAGSTVCACPTTERNLGDGIVAADQLMRGGVPIALGSDSQAQIDPLEDARQLDYHLRLKFQQRAILDQIEDIPLAQRLFRCATVSGASALAIPAGELSPGSFADFFTLDQRDLSIAGHAAADLLPLIVFGVERSAIRDVAVGGQLILSDGRHPLRDEVISRYEELHGRVWHDSARQAQ
jgi:formimidoylglutamate deiminase